MSLTKEQRIFLTSILGLVVLFSLCAVTAGVILLYTEGADSTSINLILFGAIISVFMLLGMWMTGGCAAVKHVTQPGNGIVNNAVSDPDPPPAYRKTWRLEYLQTNGGSVLDYLQTSGGASSSSVISVADRVTTPPRPSTRRTASLVTSVADRMTTPQSRRRAMSSVTSVADGMTTPPRPPRRRTMSSIKPDVRGIWSSVDHDRYDEDGEVEEVVIGVHVMGTQMKTGDATATTHLRRSDRGSSPERISSIPGTSHDGISGMGSRPRRISSTEEGISGMGSRQERISSAPGTSQEGVSGMGSPSDNLSRRSSRSQSRIYVIDAWDSVTGSSLNLNRHMMMNEDDEDEESQQQQQQQHLGRTARSHTIPIEDTNRTNRGWSLCVPSRPKAVSIAGHHQQRLHIYDDEYLPSYEEVQSWSHLSKAGC